MNFGFSMDFFAVWPGGRRCANCRDAHFFERYCDESIFTWKTFKTTMEKTKKNKKQKSSDPWARSGERPGRGHGSELFVFFVFSMVFCSLAKTSRTQKKKVQTHGQGLGYPHTNQKTKKPKNQETKKTKNQKTKKTKKQKTKKTKNQKNKKPKKKQKGQDPTLCIWPPPLGVCNLVFFFFFFGGFWVFWFFGFLVFCFFGFLVCVWIAQTLPMGLNFLFFFCVLEVLAKLQKTMEKPKKQKKQDCTPQGEGVRCRVLGLVFLFFLFFLFFCFFGFLVFWFG